jgi:hypothetical protein
VAVLENCDEVGVEGEGALFEKEKLGRVLVGPSGLDYLVQNIDEEGRIEGVELEDRVGLVSCGMNQCEVEASEVGLDHEVG